jgi:hypothetical protein
MFVRSSIRRNTAVAKLRRLSQAKKHYVTAARSAMTQPTDAACIAPSAVLLTSTTEISI